MRWLRLMYTYPGHITPKLIETLARFPQCVHYIDVPLQHAHPETLKRMKRPNIVVTRQMLSALRAAIPNVAIRTTFIVGFPGESDEYFRASLKLIKDADFTTAFSFKYSPRPGTPAAEMDDQIPEDVKADRLEELQSLINRHHERFQHSCIDRTLDVLFEKPGRNPGQITGRSPYLQPVQVMGDPSLIGDIAPVTILRTDAKSLFGVIAQPVQHRAGAPLLASLGA